MMFTMNKNCERRDEVLWGRSGDYALGGVERFDFLDWKTAQQLIDEGFANPEDAQNCAPTFKEFVDWAKRVEEKYGANVVLYGYAVSPSRSDYRVTIEGCYIEEMVDVEDRDELLLECVMRFRFADEFHIDRYRFSCWYD